MLKPVYQFLIKIIFYAYKKFKLKQNTALNFFFLTLIIFPLLIITSCNTTEPPIITPPPPVVKDTITVAVESFTHRSISLSVQSTANSLQSSIRVLRSLNNITTTIAEYPIQTTDTTIIDDDNGIGLLLDTTYTYFAVRVDSVGQLKDSSNIVTQKTLAPTSHNYTWQEFTIGDAGFSNTLYDVWGTDETNVWAVGTVMINDTAYGVLKWNGTEWLPEKTIGGLQTIFGFNESDIWVAGNGIWHYNGNLWIDYDNIIRNSGFYDNGPYTSIWGTSSSNLYLGNQWGKIIHWNGSKAEVVIDYEVYITDLVGASNDNIWATGEKSSSLKSLITHFNGNNWNEELNYPQNKLPMNTAFTINSKEVLVGGNGVYQKVNTIWVDVGLNGLGSIYKIRGSASNNMFAIGAYGVMYHFNGVDWNFYNKLYNPSGGILHGVYVTENKVFIVGYDGTIKAKLLIGSKN